jgi:putative transposase
LDKSEHIRSSRESKRERGIWQRRYWEHQIRDESDLARHVDYIHYNPVKHGWVIQPVDWPHSTLHGYIERGMATADWGGRVDGDTGGFGER